eukprot:scaffold33528_cov84-Skeletonema_dohrnii-CCMP3373.AAC.2
MKLEVFVLCQQWRDAIDMVRKVGNVRRLLPSTFAPVRFTFLEALTYLKAAQSASGWKRRQMIKQAELAALRGKNENAEESFNAGIASSRRSGFLQDRALAHELASAYFKSQGDDYWTNYHIECSRACYHEWGCSVKVEQLK